MWLCFDQAYSYSRGVRQIVTGAAEKGSESVIRYWTQELKSKKREPTPQAAKDEGLVIPRYATLAMTH
jgi:hypothetical protein